MTLTNSTMNGSMKSVTDDQLIALIHQNNRDAFGELYSRYYKKQPQEMPVIICADDIEMWKEWRNEQLKKINERAHEVK